MKKEEKKEFLEVISLEEYLEIRKRKKESIDQNCGECYDTKRIEL